MQPVKMEENLRKDIIDKIFGYLTGRLTLTQINTWALSSKHFKEQIPYIREKSDILFFLLNKAGIETRNYYPEQKIIISRNALAGNIRRCLDGNISRMDLYNWCDDVYNWELIEGFEDEIVKSLINKITMNLFTVEKLNNSDLENIIWHLEKSNDPDLTADKADIIFSLPVVRDILSSDIQIKDKLIKISQLGRSFKNEPVFNEFFAAIKILESRIGFSDKFKDFFDEISRAASPSQYIQSGSN